ncbi:MAG: hypothetical protein Q8L60_09920 [Gammaproteobacteria bacterium]|nr:hypothetical protein [Gammaproteobacteria bacterium]MDP2142478.1 hypothetical protein [Gammaproteobacteria bacterium]
MMIVRMQVIVQVIVRNGLAERMFLVRHGRSLNHPEHQGVIEHQ